MPMPLPVNMALMAETSVLCADATLGVGRWGDGGGKWSSPRGWDPLVEALNCAFMNKDVTPEWCEDILNGEYNTVFKPNLRIHDVLDMPPLPDGVTYADVVIRVTRPDGGKNANDEDFYRYKRLKNATRELFFTVHGSINGYAPQIYAAILFPAVTVQRSAGSRQLYGTVYILNRAVMDLNAVIDSKVKLLSTRVANPSVHTKKVREVGATLAVKVFPVVFRQSKLGVLNFDVKPGNLVFMKGAVPCSIDFDSAMFSIMPPAIDGDWEAHLLMNLLLLTAHVRCFRPPALADGWVEALRPLILQLLVHSRGHAWLQVATPKPRDFAELLRDTHDAATARFEMMIHAYFVQPTSKSGHKTPFRVDTGRNAPRMLHQVARFALHGSIGRDDSELQAILAGA